jgi:hypothetical protein
MRTRRCSYGPTGSNSHLPSQHSKLASRWALRCPIGEVARAAKCSIPPRLARAIRTIMMLLHQIEMLSVVQAVHKAAAGELKPLRERIIKWSSTAVQTSSRRQHGLQVDASTVSTQASLCRVLY